MNNPAMRCAIYASFSTNMQVPRPSMTKSVCVANMLRAKMGM